MRNFVLIWIGQLVSLTGSSLTAFALGVWVYQQMGSVTLYSLVYLSAIVPFVLVSPLAGAVVDRWNRRTVMMVSDFGAGVCTLIIALLLYRGNLEIWHICLLNGLNSTFNAFQYPAFTAAITQITPAKHLAKASGMSQAGRAVTRLMLAPILAGALLMSIGLWGILLIDCLSFLFAFTILCCISIPDTEPSSGGTKGKGSLSSEAIQGWAYIFHQPGLFGLLLFFAVGNFFLGLAYVLFTPLILSFTSAAVLGGIVSIGGAGMLVGGVSLGIWGENKRLMNAIFAFSFLIGLCIFTAGLHTNLGLLGLTVFIYFFAKTIISGCVQVLIQKTVAHDLQGRVFSASGAVVAATLPLAYASAGPLVDRVFQPISAFTFLQDEAGAGIRLLLLITGLAVILITGFALLTPALRHLENQTPNTNNS